MSVAVLAMGVAACHDDHGSNCPTDPPTIDSFTVTPTSAPPGATLEGKVAVSHFELSGEPHQHTEGLRPGLEPQHDDEPAEECVGGHVHIYLDDLETNPLGMPTSAEFTFDLPSDAVAGAHTLIARLHTRDHKILEPQVTAEAAITVE